MTGLLFLFGLFLALELFFLAAFTLRLPIVGTAKAMLGDVKQEKRATKTIGTYLIAVVVRLVKYTHMDEYKRSRTYNALKASGTNLTPEVYQVYTFMKAGVILLDVIPYMFLLPLLSPVVIILSLPTHFKESQKADERLKVERDEIEGELPRLVATIEQELKAGHNITGMLERFKRNARTTLAGELDILLVDIRSSNYEAALIRFKARLNFPMLSGVVRGLIGVLCGDDSSVYFRILAHDLKQLELQRLKAQIQKIPPKIGVFSLTVLMCPLLTYLTVIVYIVVTSLGGMLQERREAMCLKGWIESHPQSSFDMMTPGGYVFLTPKQAKEPLEGKGVKAHLGISGYDMTVSAEELLVQNVVNAE